MASISASELNLLTFFEGEPKIVDANVPWIYNTALYEHKQSDLSLSFSVAPSYKDIQIILRLREQILYEMKMLNVDDVIYLDDSGRESLEIKISDKESLWICLKPFIYIRQESE